MISGEKDKENRVNDKTQPQQNNNCYVHSNIILKTYYPYYEMNKKDYLVKIRDRIFSYISKLSPDELKICEIESKFGNFSFFNAYENFSLIAEPFIIPSFSSNKQPFRFNIGVENKFFYLIYNALYQEEKVNGSNIQRKGPFFYDEFLYRSGKRVSYIYKGGAVTNGGKPDIIKKEGKEHINVRNGGLDFRITCSKEVKSALSSEEENDKRSIETTRKKYRISFKFSFFRIDLSIVNQKENNKQNVMRYEVEIELLVKEIVLYYNLKNPEHINSIKILIDRFLQNIISINSIMSNDGLFYYMKTSDWINENKPITNPETNNLIYNKYGDYLRTNLIFDNKQ